MFIDLIGFSCHSNFFFNFGRKYRSETEFANELIRDVEKTEVDIMNSRADEQANLIAFYKNRSDDCMRKSVNVEKLNQELIEQKDQLERDLENLNAKFNKKRLVLSCSITYSVLNFEI